MNGDAILFGISRTFTNLTFDGFFALVVTGIAGIDHSGHGRTPLYTSLNGERFFQNVVSYNNFTTVCNGKINEQHLILFVNQIPTDLWFSP